MGPHRGDTLPFDYDFRLRIRAPRPTVFERLLRIEHLSRWFCGWSRIEPKVGGSFKFGGETCILQPEGRGWETTIDKGEVLRSFAFTWPIRGIATRVSYTLDDDGADATILEARHSGVPIRDSTCGTMQDAWRMCLGNLKSIAEGRTDSVRPDHSAVTSPELRLSALVEAAPARVFQALTDPAELDGWTTGGVPTKRARAELRAGGAFAFGREDGPDRILEIERGRRMVLRWPLREGELRVSLELEEKASGTALYVVASGYADIASPRIIEHRGRWSDLLVCLKNQIESGHAGFLNAYEDQMRAR